MKIRFLDAEVDLPTGIPEEGGCVGEGHGKVMRDWYFLTGSQDLSSSYSLKFLALIPLMSDI